MFDQIRHDGANNKFKGVTEYEESPDVMGQKRKSYASQTRFSSQEAATLNAVRNSVGMLDGSHPQKAQRYAGQGNMPLYY